MKVEKVTELFDKVTKTICGARQDNYGKPENNFASIAEMWNGYLHAKGANIDLQAEDVSHLMALLKIARIANSNQKTDSYIDAIGYLAIFGSECK